MARKRDYAKAASRAIQKARAYQKRISKKQAKIDTLNSEIKALEEKERKVKKEA